MVYYCHLLVYVMVTSDSYYINIVVGYFVAEMHSYSIVERNSTMHVH